MTKDEALKLALDALEYHTAQTRTIWQTEKAVDTIKMVLAQPNRPMHPELKKMWEDYFDKCFAAFAKDHAKLFEAE